MNVNVSCNNVECRVENQPTVSFKISELIDRIHCGHSRFNAGTCNDNVIVLWWPRDPNDRTQCWFNLRLFVNTRSGYLRDDAAYFDIEFDLPLDALYDKVDEMLVMATMAEDPSLLPGASVKTELSLASCSCRLNAGYFVDHRFKSRTWLDTLDHSSRNNELNQALHRIPAGCHRSR